MLFRSIRWQARPISKKGEKDQTIEASIKGYNVSLCDYAAKSMSDTCPPAIEGEAYVGNAVCRACHADAFEVYEKTSHAKAWKTLEDAGKQCDVGCIQCHSVGFQKGGFHSLEKTPQLTNVQCENCHGIMAEQHWLQKKSHLQERNCTNCHKEIGRAHV